MPYRTPCPPPRAPWRWRDDVPLVAASALLTLGLEALVWVLLG